MIMIDLILDKSVNPSKIKEALDHGKRNSGVTRKEIAKELGITVPMLYYISTGKNVKSVSLNTLVTIQSMTGFTLIDENFFKKKYECLGLKGA